MQLELSEATHEAIKAFCATGDQLAEEEKYDAAIEEYHKAWHLIPEPKDQWEAATWVLAAIADAYFLSGQYLRAKQALTVAMGCPGAIGNPFLHLRFGQVRFELDELDRAADELIRAYMGAGEEIFENEDSKYFDFLKTRAII